MSGHYFLTWPMNTRFVMRGEDHVVQNCRIQYTAGNAIARVVSTIEGRERGPVGNRSRFFEPPTKCCERQDAKVAK